MTKHRFTLWFLGVGMLIPASCQSSPFTPQHVVLTAGAEILGEPRVLVRGLGLESIAGTGKAGKTDGPAHTASLDAPLSLTTDTEGNVYIADANQGTLRKLDTQGQVSTLTLTPYHGTEKLERVWQIHFQDPDRFWIYDYGQRNVYLLNLADRRFRYVFDPAIFEVPLPSRDMYPERGKLPFTHFSAASITHCDDQTLYLSDSSVIWKIQMSAAGQFQFIQYAGSRANIIQDVPSGANYFKDGPAKLSVFNNPADMTCDSHGNLYVADTWNHRIRKVAVQDQQVSTLTGYGRLERASIDPSLLGGYEDGPLESAQFDGPQDLIVFNGQDLLVADSGNKALRLIRQGRVYTLINNISISGMARFKDRIYLSDISRHRIYALSLAQTALWSEGEK